MKKLAVLFLSVALLGLSATTARAAEAQATEAKVIKVTGSATALLPGQSGAVAITQGMNLPVGSSITTDAGATVDIQALAGALTTIRQNSTVVIEELSVNKNGEGVVTKQTAMLNLKSGNLASALDPAMKRINNYGVRTPKGVAAARGTVYTVSVTLTTTTVATLSGTVTLTPVGGGASIVIDIATGMAVTLIDGQPTGEPQPLATLMANEAADNTSGDENSITTAVTQAQQTIDDAISSGAITNPSSVVILQEVSTKLKESTTPAPKGPPTGGPTTGPVTPKSTPSTPTVTLDGATITISPQ
ncbi:MAG: FecR domain-containing protein [Opitutaceae bacterium]|nr:FecR domain-containing protein [Opitutaceae bacterium]MBP9912531.1 FecR domain-containing protein [Opitutaceae bacterium]